MQILKLRGTHIHVVSLVQTVDGNTLHACNELQWFTSSSEIELEYHMLPCADGGKHLLVLKPHNTHVD